MQTPQPNALIPDSLFDSLQPATPGLIARVASLRLSSKPTEEGSSPHALSILARVAKDPAFSPASIGLPPPAGDTALKHVVEKCSDKLLALLDEWTVSPTREDIDKKIEEVIWMNAVVYTIGGWGGRNHSEDPNKQFNGDFFLYVPFHPLYRDNVLT